MGHKRELAMRSTHSRIHIHIFLRAGSVVVVVKKVQVVHSRVVSHTNPLGVSCTTSLPEPKSESALKRVHKS